ncbi:TetR family transcriptional regulator [Humibacillus xanthopallidus]|uniref:TetR family transcriptional regulator n=1 Tax=Humibacillus xanthopallidus TaxID=412689 RepID=A0A543PRA2_9MICO|nr:TetR/AcrR family transcriptional regulator [Humibacillus xanthopallidus]TQN46601.1 TetR family transcriptional regulator [Humibacillus xanthopallidus]
MTRPRPRDVLLDKAIGYYAANGVGDTSLRTLASSIGTSQRMLHYHFGSREDLLAAVIESVVTAQIATLDRLFAEEHDPFEAGRRNWEAAAASAQTFGPLFFELASHAMRGRPYAVRLGEVIVTAHVAAFRRAYATVTDDAQAEVLARLTLAVGQGVLLQLLIDGNRPAADAAVDELTQMVRARLEGSVRR